MRDVKIVLQRHAYIPGETVDGKVILKCDEYFKCEQAYITLVGAIAYSFKKYHTGRGGSLSRVEIKTVHGYGHKDTYFMAENIGFDAGTHEIPFQFHLPTDLIPSFTGYQFGSFYTIYVAMARPQKAELSILEQISMKAKKSYLSTAHRIYVVSPMKTPPEIDDVGSSIETPPDIEENRGDTTGNPLVLKMDSSNLCLGEDLVFSYRINTDMKFKELLIEIEYLEHWKGNDWLRKQIRNTWSRKVKKIPGDRVTRNEWVPFKIQRPAIAPRFSLDLLENSPSLKVSIVKRYKQGEVTARIPLNVGHCLTADWREKAEKAFQNPAKTKLKGRVVKPIPPEEKKPDNERMAQNWYNRAVKYRDIGEIETAIRSVKIALKWSADSEEALALLEELKLQKEEGA